MEVDKSDLDLLTDDTKSTTNKFNKRNYDVQFDLGSHLHYSILPLLQQQPTTNLSKHDVINLANTLIKLKKYILNFELSFSNEYKDFFYSLVALSSNCIITNISAITKNQVHLICEACSILIKYLLELMSNDIKQNLNEDIDRKFQKLNLVYAFCGQTTTNLLSKNELDSLCAILKSSKLPNELILNDNKTTSNINRSTSDSNELKRIKIDRVDYLIDHLSLPIAVRRNQNDFSFNDDQDKDVKQNCFQKNLLTLRQLDAIEILLEFISKFQNIKINIDYLNKLKSSTNQQLFNDKINLKDDLKSNIDEFTKLINIISLPILDDNQNERCLELMTNLIQTSIYTCVNLVVHQSIAELNCLSNNENYNLKERHSLIRQFINLILKFYKNKLNSILKNQQQLIHNMHLFTTWIMFTGIEEILNRSKSISEQNKITVTHLLSSIVNHALDTFGFILEDLVYDFNKDHNLNELLKDSNVKSIKDRTIFYKQFNVQIKLTASKRVQLLLNEISILPLILELSYSSFIYALDQYNKMIEDDQINQDNQKLNNQKKYNRFISDLDKDEYDKELSTDDDDSEPILGRLFNENEEFKKNEQNRKQDYLDLENRPTNEIQESINISRSVFMFLNTYFICSESEYERNLFKLSLDCKQIELLSNVIKKLDCLDEDKHSKDVFKDFSKFFSLFIHNLIATESLTNDIEMKLLEQLNVHPLISKENYSFFIKPRALSILAQVLMIKIKYEKDAIKSNKNTLGLSMWKGILDRLIDLIKTKQSFIDLNDKKLEDEDINLEHAQLLMFVFHNLTLLQRKQIAIDLCQRICDLSEFLNLNNLTSSSKDTKDHNYLTNHQLLYLSRLLHFFEYIIKNLYEIPQHLIEQINTNLFEFYSTTKSINLTSNLNSNNNQDQQFSELNLKLNNCLKEHQQQSSTTTTTQKPYNKYYDLLFSEHKQSEYSQRLNDIALNFLFYFKSDKLRYERFYKSIMQFLLIGNYFNSELLNDNDRCQCNIQYCFNIIWRLFLLLPPSIQYLEEQSIELIKQDSLRILTLIIWQPRLVYSKYYRNFLLATIKKQSSDEENTDQLIDNYLKYYTPISFNIELIKSYVDDHINRDKQPSIFDQFILECLISRLWIMLDYSSTKQSATKIEAINTNEQIKNLINEYSIKLPDYLPDILIVFSKLLTIYYTYFKDSFLRLIEFKHKDTKTNSNLLKSYNDILSISADEYFINNKQIVDFFPIKINNIWNFIEDNDQTVNDLYNDNWKTKLFKGDLPIEQLIMENWKVHFFQLSTTYSTIKQDLYSSSQLAYTILILLRSTESLINWFKTNHKNLNENEKLKELVTINFMKILTPLNIDYTLQSFSNFCKDSIEYIWSSDKNEEFQIELKLKVLEICYSLLTEQYDYVDVNTKVECVRQFKILLNSYVGQASLESFFCDNLPNNSTVDIITFFKSASKKEPNNKYAVAMMKFLIKLIEETDQNLESVALVRLCSLLKKIGDTPSVQDDNNEADNWIEKWFYKLLCKKDDIIDNNSLMSFNEENYQLIKKLSSFIVKSTSIIDESVSQEFIKSLITISTSFLNSTNDKMSFPELMVLMTQLASKDNGTSHVILIKASINWLNICTNYLSKNEVLEKIELGITVGRHQIILHSASYILSYLELVFEALKTISIEQTLDGQDQTILTDNLQQQPQQQQQQELEWTDDLGCDETTSEGSEEDTINTRLCTFTITKKEFMNQHWYHCHTCKMVDGVGVCTICARVCHRGHDVTYSKHGSFFCDCGVKADGSCQALTERTSTIEKTNVYKLPSYVYPKDRSSGDQSASSGNKKLSTDSAILSNLNKQKLNLEKKINLETLCRQLKDHKEEILNEFKNNNIGSTVVKLLKFLSKSVILNNQRFSPIDSAIRTRNALDDLHKIPKTGQQNNQLAIPTLGSQEGAFENIKTSYSGELGQRIKYLMSNNLLKRVGMIMLNQVNGKKQHLAISHEKGKITILQLSSLLRQIDSSKKKISLTRLSSASVPFTILTIASNSSNDSVLSVCGLRDCHVLTFNSSGHLSGHLILQLNLKKVNYIIKSIWLPGSQSELAIITADFVTIYNLSESLIKPAFCFELPEKIRDATFLFTPDGKRYFLFLSILGEVYYEQLNSKSQSQNTPYFVTSQIEFKFKEDFQSVIGRYFNDGGVSIFYSHLFQLLFLSFENGTTLAVPMKDVQQDTKTYFLINVTNTELLSKDNDQNDLNNTINLTIANKQSNESNENSNTSSKNGTPKKTKFKPVCNWFEVANHPGLIMASTRDENNPILFSIQPESISYQEIKENIKTKIVDTVAIRHSTSSESKTTTIVVLCEDGSLQIFNAFNENTSYWLNPMFNCKQLVDKQSLIMNSFSKSKKSKKSSKKLLNDSSNNSSSIGREISFPIDFFESTQQINDIEFGGNDLLQIYNSAQLKNRLLSQSTYIACTKANGFNLEITNNDPLMVVVGIRVLLGTQSVAQSPSFIEIFDRYINIQLSRYRWFDIPFTREETLLADRKFNVFFGPPNDASSTTYVDTVLVYGKSRDLFLWPDEESESCNINQHTSNVQNTGVSSDLDIVSLSCLYSFDLSVLERILSSSFEIVNDCLIIKNINTTIEDTSTCLNVSTELLTLPFPLLVHQKLKNLLLQLHSNKQLFYVYRDTAVLNYILEMFLQHKELNGEPFLRILNLIKSILGYRSSNFAKFIETIVDDYNNNINSNSISTKFLNLLIETFELNVKKEKLSVKTIFICIMKYFDKLYWNFYRKWPKLHLSIYSEGNFVLELITQTLVEVIYCFTLINEDYMELAMDIYIKFFCAENTIINYNTRQSLMQLLRSKKVKKTTKPNSQEEKTTNAQLEIKKSKTAPLSDVQALAEIVQLDDDSDNNFQEFIEQQGRFIEDFENQYADLNNLAEDLINDSVNEDDVIERLPLYQILNESLLDNDEELLENDELSLNLPEQQINLPRLEIPNEQQEQQQQQQEQQQPLSSSSSFQQQNSNEPINLADEANQSPSLNAFKDLNFDKLASKINDFYIPNANNEKTHNIKILLLENMIKKLDQLKSVGGVRCIPFMQIVLMIAFELDAKKEKEKQILIKLINGLLEQLKTDNNEQNIIERNPVNEVKLIIMRLLSILLSRFKSYTIAILSQKSPKNNNKPSTSNTALNATTASSTANEQQNETFSIQCAKETVKILAQSELIDLSLKVLTELIKYWNEYQQLFESTRAQKQSSIDNNNQATATDSTSASTTTANTLPKLNLKTTSQSITLDMSPFFVKQQFTNKGHTEDVFDLFPQLLTEMVVRLPYQIKKLSNILNLKTTFTFNDEWTDVLCQYMMLQLTPYIRKQVRKSLTFICGSKEKYRQTRDFYSLNTYVKEINKLCLSNTPPPSKDENSELFYTFSYENTILLIENLKSVLEIASNRTANWQKYCWKNSELLCFFVKVSIFLDENVSNTILQLLQLAICTKTKTDQQTIALLNNIERKEEEDKKEDITVELVETTLNAVSNDENDSQKTKNDDHSKQISYALAKQLISKMDVKLLSNFIRTFLLESNNTLLRWQCHTLIYKMFRNFNENSEQRIFLLDSLWYLWDSITKYGLKASQFVDLLGYFTFKSTSTSTQIMEKYVEKTLNILNQQNQLLFQHPNYLIYNNLQKIVNFDGYYLESEPCLVCNNPETNYSNLKLSSLKVDSRFTTTTQIVKLVGSHIIAKINLRITDIKKTKMVKVINIYYNNWPVNSVVELKNRTVWHKAKRCYLSSGQSEVKIDFPLPITACNLKIEYAEFYENQQANASETLQCPRCSTTVPANPGVCQNCNENVYQCHKCRNITYDERDPYLCLNCGFSKYGKFDFILQAKPTCAVDPIKDEEGRKKTVQNVNSLLERADTLYKQLNAIKPTLEILLLKNEEHGFIDKISLPDETVSSSSSTTTTTTAAAAAATTATITTASTVNKTIQQIAFKYCNECKSLFEELSKIIQKLLASRKEVVVYDNLQRLETYPQFCDESTDNNSTRFVMRRDSKMLGLQNSSSGRCYGCATSSIEHCVTLLKGLANLPVYRELFCSKGLHKILIDENLKLNNLNLRKEIRQLLSLLLKDNKIATEQLEKSINTKIEYLTRTEFRNQLDFVSLIKNEIAFLSNVLETTDDIYWETKLRCLMRIFFVGLNEKDPNILNAIVLPSLRILSNLIKVDSAFNIISNYFSISINEWLKSSESFEQWKSKRKQLISATENDEKRLELKYFNNWKIKIQNKRKMIHINKEQKLIKGDWIKSLIFNKYSLAVRMMTCSFIESFFQATNKKIEIVHLLTSYLDYVNENGNCSTEFFHVYTNIIKQDHWKYYLALKGLLPHLGKLINSEIDRLLVLNEENINSDLSDGIALKLLVDLLISFVDVDLIRHHYKSKLVVFILNGYLSLRKLVVRRTKIIDETQDNLLELLEEMTTGTETETSSFMSVCVQSVKCCKLEDLRTPVFIFERLCSIIYPEDNTTSEFYITLEKDSAQEDFLQGRMLGNPYSSLDPGFGPLMRDIKNKICQDCELVALLDDDNGMELLVMDKIISLDLPVKDVYRKIWCSENNESHPMLIVYRMRGLMGDATEEFIENLDLKNVENENVEEVYKMAKVMSNCGGLEVMLERLNQIKDLTARCKPLMIVLLKLFDHCVKLSTNRKHLIDPKLNTITIFMKVLKIIINAPSTSLSTEQSQSNKTNLLEQILKIIEVVLLECSKQNLDQVENFLSPIKSNEFEFLLHSLQSENVQKNSNVLNLLLRIIPFLTLDSKAKMQMVLEHFKPYLNFNKFDYQNTSENSHKLECFCIMMNSIEKNKICQKFKDYIVAENVVVEALEYLTSHSPPIKCAMLANSKEWKEFTQRPSLKYVLRILTGITSGHELSQILVTSQYVSIIHGLEQVSSDAHVGSLAENLLEELKQNEHVAAVIDKVRKETKEEKKRLAMAVRQKQLGELGLKANERGQVIAKSSILKQVEDLGDEQGLTCIICREGYKFQPNKVLGIYTFTKKCPLEAFETKTNKTMGYSTVTHFNVIHFDCHLSAVKHARIRDEWESAALQNGNTKCNGLLPLWGPSVQDSVFESCLVHHNSYLQESTNCREISYTVTLHDFKLLLLKFASEESFSIDTGGGGPQSNIHLIPYLIHMALYVMNTTQKSSRNIKMVKMFLEEASSRFVENSFEVENVYYYAAMHVLVFDSDHWNNVRTKFLQRFLITAHSRKCSKGKSIQTLSDKTPKEYKDYKTELVFFALIDGIYKHMFKNVEKPKDEETWSTILADYIRHNDQQLLETAEQLLQYYEQDLLPCSTFDEFCDIVGLLDEITNPQQFLIDTLQLV